MTPQFVQESSTNKKIAITQESLHGRAFGYKQKYTKH